MSDPVDEIMRICNDAEDSKLTRIAAVLGFDESAAQQAQTAPVVPNPIEVLRNAMNDVEMPVGERPALVAHFTNNWNKALSAAPSAPANSEDAKDAARWRALLNSARIRPLGSAGIKSPEPDSYAHLGLELWTVFGNDLNSEWGERLANENAVGREWLTAFADIAATAQQKEGE